MTFAEIGLAAEFSDRLAQQGITQPTPIQAEVFKPIVEGQSVLGLSKTGTGKTFAFLCPLVQRMAAQPLETDNPVIRGLVLVPTRELASQVARDLETLAGDAQKGTIIVGGEAEDRQIQSGKDSTWIIATPGRLLDLLDRRLLDISQVQAVAFDEADRLLDMGFIDEIRAIMKLLPKGIQMLFFSATLHFGVDEMSYEFGAECFRFGQEEEQMTVEGLDHSVSFIGDQEKFHALAAFIREQGETRGIVFSNYRDKAHEVSSRLRGLGCEAASLTAQLTQSMRSRIMQDFRDGKVQVLLASDLASRGLDVIDIDWVVNYDLPEDPAIYVHRVGRTARAGRKGKAISFIGFEDSFRLEKLERFLGGPIQRHPFPVEGLQGRLQRFKPGPATSVAAENSEDFEGNRSEGLRSGGPRGPRGNASQGRHSGDGREGGRSGGHQPRERGPKPQFQSQQQQARGPRPATDAPRGPSAPKPERKFDKPAATKPVESVSKAGTPPSAAKQSWYQKCLGFFARLFAIKADEKPATKSKGSVGGVAAAATPGASGSGRRRRGGRGRRPRTGGTGSGGGSRPPSSSGGRSSS